MSHAVKIVLVNEYFDTTERSFDDYRNKLSRKRGEMNSSRSRLNIIRLTCVIPILTVSTQNERRGQRSRVSRRRQVVKKGGLFYFVVGIALFLTRNECDLRFKNLCLNVLVLNVIFRCYGEED